MKEQKRALELLEVFGLLELVENEEEIFDLEVGENGKRLSGGQAKRLCLVRSLMSGAAYLIWDDPFSSVDMILEKQIILKLREDELLKKKTVLLSSHRISTVRYCDQLYFLDRNDGIIETGQVMDLLNEESKTNEYFQRQLV